MCVCGGGGERERVTERDRERETDGQTEMSTHPLRELPQTSMNYKQLSDGRWSLDRDRRSQKHTNQVAMVTGVIHVHILSSCE